MATYMRVKRRRNQSRLIAAPSTAAKASELLPILRAPATIGSNTSPSLIVSFRLPRFARSTSGRLGKRNRRVYADPLSRVFQGWCKSVIHTNISQVLRPFRVSIEAYLNTQLRSTQHWHHCERDDARPIEA
jgi:hypothetical protein